MDSFPRRKWSVDLIDDAPADIDEGEPGTGSDLCRAALPRPLAVTSSQLTVID
ncbi:hypothetical protein [Micromonospora sp. NPDC049102]|uniref:hypothetical protein n=1 Tax=Micromonospora sp. NPDC049102 TaxID=3364265 RepID=UPI0037215AD4